VLRRGAVLREISLVDIGAYESAKVAVVDPDAELHQLTEIELGPLREQRACEAEQRRQRHRELIDWVAPPPPIAEPVDLGRVIPDTDGRVLVRRRGMGMQW
jgi:hypothetical protein